MILSDRVREALGSSATEIPSVMFLDAETPLRMWSGSGSIDLPPDGVDLEGGEYLGAGDLIGVDSVSQLINGLAERINLVLSGADREAIRLTVEDAQMMRRSPVYWGCIPLDRYLQPIETPIWVWQGEVDTPKFKKVSDTNGVETLQIILSIGSVFTGRKRPNLGTWTPSDQRGKYPGDAVCDRVPGMTQDMTARWPT